MPQIPLEPEASPKTRVYKYFFDKLNGKISHKGNPVPFLFSKSKKDAKYPCVYLEFYRHAPPDPYRHLGDTIVARNLETGNFEKVTIGEPYEAYWGIVIEGTERDPIFAIDQQIRVLMGRAGKTDTPVYIEHSRYPRFDFEGDNSLTKADSDTHLFISRLGYRVYTRLSGGIPLPDYEPRPPVEEIVLQVGVDGSSEPVEEVITDDSETP